jgi:hypothetical protein
LITAPSGLQNIFYNNTSVQTAAGCYIEYNMNSLIPNISVSSSKPDTKYFHVFTLDSIIKPFRPSKSGIKYTTLAPLDEPKVSTTTDFTRYPSNKSVIYPSTAPRRYMPGMDSVYKYYLTEIGEDLNAKVKYVQFLNTIKSAYATGEYIQYETSAPHGFTIGLTVSVSGFTNTLLNCSSLEILDVPSATTFKVTKATAVVKKVTATATATLSKSTKYAIGNKIIATFNKDHYLPSTCNITIKTKNAVSGQADITTSKTSLSIPESGCLALYFDGSSWSATAPSEPLSFGTGQYISEISIDATGASGKFIGLIELALIYIKDISSDVVSFSETKDSSSDNMNILPVGTVTSNNLSIDLVNYSADASAYVPYDLTMDLDISKIYLYKNVKLTPYIKFYDASGPITKAEEPNNYYKISPGSYYISDYKISTYGEVSINALDAGKYLTEKIAPDMLLENYPATGVIRSLLDSVGFVDYNINVVTADSKVTDTSIPFLSSWWTDGSKTVWQCIQEICQDMQINAIFDSNNILQFYTREYMYSTSKNIDWNFYYEKNGSALPNIVSFDQQQIPSANQVKVKWSTPLSSRYTGSSSALWTSPITFLSAGGLLTSIAADSSPENTTLMITLDTIDKYSINQSLYSFSGYVLIDSEIIEYDAIQYKCDLETPYGGQSTIYPWMESQADIAKYRSLSKSGYSDSKKPDETAYFKPTGKYRVKKRGALGTTPAAHNANGNLTDLKAKGWTSVGITWKEK